MHPARLREPGGPRRVPRLQPDDRDVVDQPARRDGRHEYRTGPRAGEVTIEHVDNPRVEIYDHYYKVVHTALESLGLKPTLLSTTLIDHLFDVVERYRDRVDPAAMMPTVKWAETTSELPRTASELAKT